MNEVLELQGAGGVPLAAESWGDPRHPAVLLVHGAGESRTIWRQVAEALAAAGRYAIAFDLRGHGESHAAGTGLPHDLDTLAADLRLVLAAMTQRPVVVASPLGALVALVALGEASTELASALCVVDAALTGDAESPPAGSPALAAERLERAATTLRIPTLVVAGGGARRPTWPEQVAGAERGEVDDGALLDDRAEAFNAVLLEFLERRVPRAPLRYESGSDARTLRDALGCFATGVTVVTAQDAAGAPVGLTVNSFTSVSLEPPLILFCLARSSSALGVFEAAAHFGVNVLHIGQQPTSNRFATRGGPRFEGLAWEAGGTGAPLLTGSLASFECRTFARHDGGDHLILIGQVVRAHFEPSRDPLLYHRGKYRRLHFS